MKDQTQEARDYLCSLDQFSYYTNYINRTETGLAGDFAYDLVKYLKSLPQPEITQADMDKALKERDTAIVDEWISVDKEEPPVGKDVLCLGSYFHGAKGYEITARLSGNNNKEGWKYTRSCFYVTQWTYLPEIKAESRK